MKRGWLFCLLLLCIAVPVVAHAQVAAYGEFTTTELDDGPKGDFTYGATAGVLIDGPKLFHRLQLSADINGRFVSRNGERLDSVSVGPRIGLGSFKKISPFIGFDVGFGRYNNGSGNSTTDNLFGGSAGVTRRVSSRLDAVLDFKYEYYGANFNFYNPVSYSGGVIYHFAKR